MHRSGRVNERTGEPEQVQASAQRARVADARAKFRCKPAQHVQMIDRLVNKTPAVAMPSQSNVGVGPKILSACLLSSARRFRSSSEKFIRQLSTGHNSSHLRAEAMLAHNRPEG